MEEDSLETSDLNPEDVQGGKAEQSDNLEDDGRTSEEMVATIHRQGNQILNLQEQLREYRHALDSCCQDIDERWMDIKRLKRSREEFLTIIQELKTKNSDLEIKLFVNLAFQQLVQTPVPVEEEEQESSRAVEEEKEPSLDGDVQTKSWLRRQAESLWKVIKRMGTFCQGVLRCRRFSSCMRKIFQSNQVHPVGDDILPV